MEKTVRIKAIETPNVYYLVIFACCREGKQTIKSEVHHHRKRMNAAVLDSKIANFTFLFGCDPAAGVPASTQLVNLIVEHLNDYFDPMDGSALIPQCFGVIDAIRKDVALESTSCNLGKSLRLQRRDNRVDKKQLIVIV